MSAISILFSRSSYGSSSFCAAGDTLSDIEPLLPTFEKDLPDDSALVIAQFKGERGDALREAVAAVTNATRLTEKYEIEQLETLLEDYLFPCSDSESSSDHFDDSMDGDHDSAMADAGMGTSEDYGDFGQKGEE